MTLTNPTRLLLAPLLAFAAGLLVWTLLRSTPPLPAASAPADVVPTLTGTSADIGKLQRAVAAAPARADLRVDLASAYLQRVRETGDPAFYTRAGGVLAPALRAHSDDPDVNATAGTLALARHDFRGGLEYGRRAQPCLCAAPVVVDALVELGRYGDATRALQQFVDAKPNLSGYARVSYLRELHGDLDGAVSAMRLAVAAGGPALENVAYVSALLGELERQQGHVAAARVDFRRALVSVAGTPGAEAGMARIEASAGDLHAAAARWRSLAQRLPLPEYVIGLGETELAAGDVAAGRRDLELIGAEEKLLHANGVNTDVELAIYEADHGSPARAVALARRAWGEAPSVRAADALGWALTRAGQPSAGLVWAHRALRLGSVDPLFRAHAGLTALAAGRRGEGVANVRLALAHGLAGWPWQAQRARRALARHGLAAAGLAGPRAAAGPAAPPRGVAAARGHAEAAR